MADRLISVPAARAHIEVAVGDQILKGCMNNVLDALPAVDAVPVVHGQWITNDLTMDCECSICGRTFEWWEDDEAHYCPNCGAKMDGGADNA